MYLYSYSVYVKRYTKYILTALIIICLCLPARSQSADRETTLSGLVVDQAKSPVAHATITLDGKNVGKTNAKGLFTISFSKNTPLNLRISSIGKKVLSEKVSRDELNAGTKVFMLEEEVNQLEAIEILGLSKVDEVNKQSFNVTALDATKLHNTSMDVGQLINRVSGVRVRESGGLGSQTAISLNGFTGNQVKLFLDGLPIDNYGSSFQINNIPINYINQIEVYKGVVPVWLGGDALGGAINLVKNTKVGNFLDASYSYGSFNTHRANFNLGYIAKNGFTLELNGYKNYSKNNYWVDINVVPDIESGVTIPDRVRRFHDQYDNQMLGVNVGVSNKKWADQFLVGLQLGDNHADIQTGNRMDDVFGARFREGTIILPSLYYKKDDFLLEGLDISLRGSFNLGKEKNVDTVYRQFNWYGESIPKGQNSSGGEVSRELYTYKNNNGNAALNVKYAINPTNTLYFNNTFTSTDRKGENPLQPDNDFYKQPKQLQKNITGLALGNADIKNMVNQVFIKHYAQHVHSYQVNNNVYSDYEESRNMLGYGLAFSYALGINSQVKFSYEKTYRMPAVDELFGDVINLTANPQLKPESSHNFNLNVNHTFLWKEKNALSISADGIYRQAKDFIRYVNSASNNNNNMLQMAQNQRDVNNIGADFEVHYAYERKLNIAGSVTYQNLRNRTKYETSTTDVSIFYKDRLPNIPYLFGHGDISYEWKDVLLPNSNLKLGAYVYYVHDYFLRWPSAGAANTKEVIPEQLSYDASLVYSFASGKYNIGIDGRNLSDALLYDNYMLQKPSRNFSIKFRYTITK